MCIRAGANELESVKNLMSMSLMAVIAETLEVEIDEIRDEARLVEDLGMNAESRGEMEAMIADFFDGLEVNLNQTPTVAALVDKVVLSEFRDAQLCEYASIPNDRLNSSVA
jgi:hypothetical protein